MVRACNSKPNRGNGAEHHHGVSQLPPRGGVSAGGARGGVNLSDADAILNEVPGVVAIRSEVSAEYLQIKSWDVESVTMFSQQQVASAAKVDLLVPTVVEVLTITNSRTLTFRGNEKVCPNIRRRPGFLR